MPETLDRLIAYLENFTEQTPAVTHRQHRMIAANQLRLVAKQIKAERETQTTARGETS